MTATVTAITPMMNYINEYYDNFLYKFKQKSENTYKAYKSDITQFCDIMFNSKPEFVTVEQMIGLKSIDISKYSNHLTSKDIKLTTLKRKMESIKSFLEYLAIDCKEINPRIMNIVDTSYADLKSESYGEITWDEAIQLAEYSETAFGEDGKQFASLIKLACVTSFRLASLLELDWEKSFNEKDENGVMVKYFTTILKRKHDKKPISDQIYNELREKLPQTGKLFSNLYPHKVGKYLKQALKALGMEGRNIKFHSFKGTGINKTLDRTNGNIELAKVQGAHSSYKTTEKYYVKHKEVLANMPSYTIDQDIDITEDIDNCSHDELKNAISKLSDSAKLELLRILQG